MSDARRSSRPSRTVVMGLDSKTRYEPAEVEPRIVERWLKSEIFHADAEGTSDENYSVAIPPPNVTGSLHMGHALNASIQDVLMRYNRMCGRRAKWIFGTDHAGIATQTVVEKQLLSEGISRQELGREEFVKRCWTWREQHGSQIVHQFQRIGASCDYEDERFTLDERYHRAVLEVFVGLYEKGYIYRDRYMVNWDPGSHSAISDLEVEDREATDTLYYIAYPLASGEGSITVATVRPETMLGDTAVAVHPDDDRYRELIGQEVVLPLVGRRIRVIADEYVKPEFGTGALKITPGHDPNDFEVGQRHGLEQITVIGEDGCLLPEAGERFAGLKGEEAQQAVVEALRAEGVLDREEPYTHTVPFSHRSSERIEPLISLQWFMRMDELARPAIEVVERDEVKITPESWKRVYLNWMEELRPWCISRQLWWGHRLPVWYHNDSNEVYVGVDPPPCPENWQQDEDVLDTWFSSALWPFAALGWMDTDSNDSAAIKAFYPTDVLSTARDIIFLWVARMIMMGLEFVGRVPFDDVYIHSVIQAPDGRRMSKSLGTGIDPLDEIEKHGADAVRFGLLAMSSTQDVRYSAEKITQGQQLANKLWNASRLILLQVDPKAVAEPRPETIEDRWILAKLEAASTEMDAHLAEYDFSHAALGLYDFIYGSLCDWYLELIKPRLYEGASPELSGTLLYVLRRTLAFAHPLIPFVTEEIWSYLPNTEGLLAGSRDLSSQLEADLGAEREVDSMITAIQELRTWRDGVGAKPAAVIPARLAANGYDNTVATLARLARLELLAQEGDPVASVAIPGGSVELFESDAIDLGAAQDRLAERRSQLEAEIKRAEGKLANEGFTAKAPPELIEAEREKLERFRNELSAL